MLKKCLSLLLSLALIGIIPIAMLTVSAEAPYYENPFSGTIGNSVATISGKGANDTYNYAKDPVNDLNTVGEFYFESGASAIRYAKAESGTTTGKTGNIIFEERIRLNLSNTCSINDISYILTVTGKNKTTSAAASTDILTITGNNIAAIANSQDTNLSYIPGSFALSNDKWYTIKIGINTETNKLSFFYKDDTVGVWKTLTPPGGYAIRNTLANGTLTLANGVDKIATQFKIEKTGSGTIYRDDFKIYQAPYIGADVTPQSTVVKTVENRVGINETYEDYAVGDVYRYHNLQTPDSFATPKTSFINQTIALDPSNSNNKVRKITVPINASQLNTEIEYYYGFNPINKKAVLRFKYRFDEYINPTVKMFFYMGNEANPENIYVTKTPMQSTYLQYPFRVGKGVDKSGFEGNATTDPAVAPSGISEFGSNAQFASNTWYDCVYVIDTTTEKYEAYRKNLSSADNNWDRITPAGGYYIREFKNNDFTAIDHLFFKVQSNGTTELGNIYLDDFSLLSGEEAFTAEKTILSEIAANEEMENGGIKAAVTLVNGAPKIDNAITMTAHNANIYVACYSNKTETKDQLLSVQCLPNDSGIDQYTYFKTLSVDLPYPSANKSDFYIKAFVFENGSLKPLNQSVKQ